MKRRIIFIPQNKLTKRDYFRFGFHIIQSRGYDVESWDLTPILRSYYHENFFDSDPIEFKNNKIFMNEGQISNEINQISNNDIIVCLLHPNNINKFIFDIMDGQKIKYGFIRLTDHVENSNKMVQSIERLYRIKNNPIILVKKPLNVIINRLFNYNPQPKPYFVMVSGKNTNDIWKNKDHDSEIIKAHALDYDHYLNDIPNNANIYNGKYAVFIDNNLPFSLDDSMGNNTSRIWCRSEDYFPELVNFFDRFTKKTNLKVLIAAHPRSNYEGKNKYLFGDRIVIKNKTSSLIKGSDCVLIHQSTSVNFAVLYKKPMVFLTSKHFDFSFRARIKYLAKCFGQNPINISLNHIPSIHINLIINEEIYKAYKNNYIKMEGTPEKPIWEIFCDNIE